MHIELKEPRIVLINERGRNYTLTAAPITKKQWLKYFGAIVNTSEIVEGLRTDTFDSSGARLALVSEALIDAEGYAAPNDARVTEIANWRELIPASHRLAVGEVLTGVERAQVRDDEPIRLGLETVRLNAVWGRGEGSGMRKVLGLEHVFETPSVEQQRRYNSNLNRSQVIGGIRRGKTRWMGAQATLIDLYDELIVSVAGYTANGEPLNTRREFIVEHMDCYHKVAAAEALFVPISAAIEDNDE